MEGVKAFTIMMKDTEVMRVDFDALQYEVLSEKYLPYPIRGKLQKIPMPSGSIISFVSSSSVQPSSM